MKRVLPLHDKHQTAHQSVHKEGNCNSRVKFLPHPPYNRNSAPSNYHIFGPLKNKLQVCRFADDKKAETRHA